MSAELASKLSWQTIHFPTICKLFMEINNSLCGMNNNKNFEKAHCEKLHNILKNSNQNQLTEGYDHWYK